jgi:hypothetical protein
MEKAGLAIIPDCLHVVRPRARPGLRCWASGQPGG